jgi:hypothetical protein
MFDVESLSLTFHNCSNQFVISHHPHFVHTPATLE